MNPWISVIAPIYRVEPYLKRCVDSLLAQTYQELELWLVDDGSPDGCGLLCDAYAAADPRVRVLHKQNGGLSDARNAALALATGEYIAFVDGDDWVSPYYIQNLYAALTRAGAELAVSCFEEVFEGQAPQAKPTPQLQGYESLGQTAFLKRMLYQDGVEISAWGKLYHKKLLAGLCYPVGKLYEDIPVTYAAVRRARTIARIANRDYYYFQRKNSIQNMAFDLRKLDGVEHCRQMLEAVRQEVPELERAAECRYLSTVCNILFQIRDKAHEPQRRQLWQEVRRYRKDVALDSQARRKARLAALLSYGGYPLMRKVYDRTQWRGQK